MKESADDLYKASVSGNLAIAFDIKGPEIRTGRFAESVPQSIVTTTSPDGTVNTSRGNREVTLARGDRITLTSDHHAADAGTRERLYVALPEDLAALRLHPGQRIFIDDGQVELEVTSVRGGEASASSSTTARSSSRSRR